jgi:hypothetical protein
MGASEGFSASECGMLGHDEGSVGCVGRGPEMWYR